MPRRAFFGNRRRGRALVLIVVLVGIALWRARDTEQPQTAPFAYDSAGPYVVKRVVDGDTLLLEDGTRVRLLGVDAPEIAHENQPAEPLGADAAEFMRRAVEGRQVRLEFDRERRDQYRRVLAYVWIGERCMNEELIRAGYSRAETRFRYSDAKKRRFRLVESEARRARAGIWALAP